MAVFPLNHYASATELAEAAALDCLREIREAEERGVPFTIALSGGRIARQFFEGLARYAGAELVAFTSVHFFWADERCVPPGSPDSNYRLAFDTFLGPLEIPGEQIHRIQGEENPSQAAKEASEILASLASQRKDGTLMLDLVLLGMGEDGHVASLFPGEPGSVAANPAIYRPVSAPKPPPQRITLGYSTIAAAREVWVLASGSGKQGALRQSLSAKGGTPLARVLSQRHHTRILSDIE
jgi:6-phosphogluconolactonase